jgi:hypothetical protein
VNRPWLVLPLLAAMVMTLRAEIPRIQAEPNPEKRAKLALDNAEQALSLARDSYDKSDIPNTAGLLAEVKESVELADAALKSTGKKASRSPKAFKNAELRTSELLRRIETFSQDMNFADRQMIEPVKTTVQHVHDALLDAIMEKGK